MMYLWVALGSAIGGVMRYALTRMIPGPFPWGTIAVNILGCFVIGYFGTLTLAGGKYAEPESLRIFVMVGVCGGFTTFSSFSL
jgi:CrcB protein